MAKSLALNSDSSLLLSEDCYKQLTVVVNMMEEEPLDNVTSGGDDKQIVTQLQDAAQTDVTNANASGSSTGQSIKTSPGQPATIVTPSKTTVPNIPVSSPLETVSRTPSREQTPVTQSSAGHSSEVLAGVSVATAPGPVQTPHEASDSIHVAPDYTVPLKNMEAAAGGGTGIFGWTQDFMTKVVEKTKTSVENMITTLDPGMKEVLFSGGDMDILVTSMKEAKISPLREAFQLVFGRATVQGMESQANTAPQPVGFTAGFKGAEDRIQNLRRNMVIHEHQPVISVEGFIVEALPDTWLEMSCLILQDPLHKIDLQTFSQPTAIPLNVIQLAQDSTASDYPMRWSGLSMTIGQAVEQLYPNVSNRDWQEALVGVKRRDTLLLAGKALAGMYKQKLALIEKS